MNPPDLSLPNQLLLVLGPHAAQAQMLELAARLAVSGPLRVLDCGNQFNVYPVARAVRRRTAGLNEALGRIRLARAFTCFQALALLEETPAEGTPALVFDLLSTFYDEDVKLPESQRLLRSALAHLRRLSQAAPVIVSARPPKPIVSAERLVLLEALRATASTLWETIGGEGEILDGQATVLPLPDPMESFSSVGEGLEDIGVNLRPKSIAPHANTSPPAPLHGVERGARSEIGRETYASPEELVSPPLHSMDREACLWQRGPGGEVLRQQSEIPDLISAPTGGGGQGAG